MTEFLFLGELTLQTNILSQSQNPFSPLKGSDPKNSHNAR